MRFLPLIADSLLESLELLTGAVRLFREKCIKTLEAEKNAAKNIFGKGSHAFATEYTDRLGYDKVAEIVAEYENNPKNIRRKLEEARGKRIGIRGEMLWKN